MIYYNFICGSTIQVSTLIQHVYFTLDNVIDQLYQMHPPHPIPPPQAPNPAPAETLYM